jgi:DNA replication protein DnaC
MNSLPAFLTPKEIEQLEFVVDGEIPPSEHCHFCNKELHYLGARSLNRNIIIRFLDEPERCDCQQSIEYWDKVDEEAERRMAIMAEQQRQEGLKKLAEKLFSMSKMGARFRSRTFDNFEVAKENKPAYEALKVYANHFKSFKIKGIGYMLNGPYGTGKTHLAAALAIELINKGTPVIFGTLINLLGKIKQTYDGNWTQENESEILNAYSTVDLLIIDDLGKEKASEWSIEKLFSIINTRYENNLPVVITTNYSMETLINKLTVNNNSDVAESIVSRLHEMCRGLYLNTPDYRSKGG